MVEINRDNCGVCDGLFTIGDWASPVDSMPVGWTWVHLRCKSEAKRRGLFSTADDVQVGFSDRSSKIYKEVPLATPEAQLRWVIPVSAEASDGVTYTQLHMVCRACNLHFIVCTERPESHGLSTLYCPECGQHDARFIMYEATVPGFIFQSVPGNAEVKDIKL